MRFDKFVKVVLDFLFQTVDFSGDAAGACERAETLLVDIPDLRMREVGFRQHVGTAFTIGRGHAGDVSFRIRHADVSGAPDEQ